MKDKETIYSASYRQSNGFFTILFDFYEEIKKYKWQIFFSIRKQIKSTYQQDIFGLFWAIIMPIIPMTVYMLLAYVKVFNTVDNVPFIFYIAMGMFIWLLMSSIIRHVMLSIKKEKSILRSTNTPMLVIMITALGEILNDSFIRIFAVAIIIIWFKIDISLLSIVYAFLLLIPIIIFSFSIGVIFAIFDMIAQDTRRVVDIFLRYGIFISSVIFPFPTIGILGSINSFNFFNTYIVAFRDLVYFGTINNMNIVLYTSIVGIFIFYISMKMLYKMDYKLRAFL